MKYAEYKESAIRHLQTCKYMTKYLNYVFTPKEKFRILCNIYYLGGYVVEGILCYTIFYLIKYDLNKSVYDLKDFNKCGLKFRRDIASHRFDSKIEYVRTNGGVIPSSLPIIGAKAVSETVDLMFQEWGTKIRYTAKDLPFDLTESNVQQFLFTVEEIYNGLRRV